MKQILCTLFCFSLLAARLSSAADLDIPFDDFRLNNGLHVIVHEDRKAPIVAVSVWYHVGSKNEPVGKTGFAHLFEHLMFNGTENYNDEYFKPLQEVGATSMNGTTDFDRTNYFQTVPATALDLALWLESDRMGHLLGALDQEKLDEQRGVVQNEKRQSENRPYGTAFRHIMENVFPAGHPYSWTPIGSMEDLDAATLEDVRGWFQTYYGPNNATLVLAGDIDLATARERVQKYFGDIPPGPPLSRIETWIPAYEHDRRMILEDRVPQARIYKAWAIPEWGTDESDWLSLADAVLTDGKTSRLYQRLVYEAQVATGVGSFPLIGEMAGVYAVFVTAQPGQDLVEVERLLDEEMNKFLDEGPTETELARVKTQARASFIRSTERVGGFRGKSGILAESAVFGGRADAFKDSLILLESTEPAHLRNAAKAWLSRGAFILEVQPYQGQLHASGPGADRSELPLPSSFPRGSFPELHRSQLENGLHLIVAERTGAPTVEFSLQVKAGYASDQSTRPGTANLAMSMLDEGTDKMDALQISEAIARLGAQLRTGANLDYSFVSLSALKENMDESLEIYADVILKPAFPADELERLKSLSISAIKREKTSPMSTALRVFPKLLYGEGHPYSMPLTGSGTEESVAEISRKDLLDYHTDGFNPRNATMIVVGDITLNQIQSKLEKLFSGWDGKNILEEEPTEVALPNRPRVFLIDRPDSEQSTVIVGHLIPPKSNDKEIAVQTMNDILGGSFVSRINLNLREDKAWSYGARTMIVETMAQRPLIAYAPVQSDKTAESILELKRELSDLVQSRPASNEEIDTAKKRRTLSLPGRWETTRAILNDIAEIVRFGLPDDFWVHYADQVELLDRGRVNEAAQNTLAPENLTWVIVGDLAEIEMSVRELGLGPIAFLDADGNPNPRAEN